MPRRALLLFALLVAPAPARADDVQLGLRVPAGFEVTEFADSKLANDIFCLTLDARGRVTVSGRGYVRILVDDDGDGRADRAIDFADGPKDGAQGLLWEGKTLFIMGDGGLRRYRDDNGDDRADGPSELIRALKTGGEHDAHAIKRGPDGWLYVLCGNSARIDRTYATRPRSPIREPVAGCVLRLSPDLKQSEIVADGFRNPYDMDFDADGDLFTFDSDNERCVSLPWYEPTRFYHVLPGGHYGWLNPQFGQHWRRPPYFCDVVAPVASLGRGSPTGVACYRHAQFPQRYRGGFFVLDWTFGRVWFLKLERSGSTYTAEKEVFLESVGDNGFAPTALAVHPVTGDLFIAIGGRGTRGAVYRVRHPAGLKALDPAEVAAWRKHPERLQLENPDTTQRPKVQALIRHAVDAGSLLEFIRADWDHSDRYVRQAAADSIAALDRRSREALWAEARTPLRKLTLCQGSWQAEPERAVETACELLGRAAADRETRLTCLRVIQLGLGDLTAAKDKGTVWEGYSARSAKVDDKLRSRVAKALGSLFPAGDPDVDRELSRTLGMIEDGRPETLAKVLGFLSERSDPVEDIHYLIVHARLTAPRSAADTARTAGALLALDRKLNEQHRNRDRNWPLRVGELYAELAHKDPGLHAAILGHAEFGRPDHVLFAQAAGSDRRRAAEIFLSRAERDKTFVWTPALVDLVGSAPRERILPVLRRLMEQGGLEEAILPLLARVPEPGDGDRFLEGLRSPQLAVVRCCVEALEKLAPQATGPECLALVRALRSLPEGKEANALRDRLAALLRKATGETGLGTDKEAWSAWLAKRYPAFAARLGGADGVDVAAWAKRLAAVDWSSGDAARGQAVYTRASCVNCHSGAQALGPDLRGVTGRFSRADLFTAIVQPSRDISPRYRTTMIETANGQVYQGLVIYEAVDSLILQTGPATTVRLTNQQIASRRVTDTSLMPAGLLDKLTDRDIADLYAHLKSLAK
jgi:putative membrane-bound dehydrogenase-like protein